MVALEALAPNFFSSNHFQDLLTEIGKSSDGSTEHENLVQANMTLFDLENELVAVYKFLRENYAKRFPELETFDLSPVSYARVVLEIGEMTDISQLSGRLGEILPAAVVMIIAVTATTSQGRPFKSSEEFKVVEVAAKVIIEMIQVKEKLLQFIESKMERVAPNVSALLGTQVTSQLIGAVGGILQLSRIPAGNIQVIGAARKNLAGFSAANASLHTGFIGDSELIQETSSDFKVKAMRLLAAKVAMAARVDAGKQHITGEMGRKLKEEIISKLEKLAEPLPMKSVKPLPIPDSERKKRRGGKRARKLKEMYAMTEMRKQKNRMAFGSAESEVLVGDRMEGMGMLGSHSGIGNVRAAVASDSRLRDYIKKQGQKAAGMRGQARGGNDNHNNGLKLGDGGEFSLPKLEERKPSTPAVPAKRYFNATAGFKKPGVDGN